MATVTRQEETNHTSDLDLTKYSLSRAIHNVVNSRRSSPGGFEQEISDEIAKRTGKSPRGFFIPWNAPVQTRALDTTSGEGGVATIVSKDVITVLRPRSVCMRLGATVLPDLKGGKLAIPVVNTGGTVVWVTEAAAPPAPTTITMADQIVMSPHTVSAYIDVTRRAIDLIPNIDEVILADLTAAVAAEVDRAAINGAGGDEILGIIPNPDVPSFAAGGPSRALLVGMEALVANANAGDDSLGWVCNPDTRALFRSTETSVGSGYYLWPDTTGPLGYRAGVRTGIPNDLVYGNWSDMGVGIWGSLDLVLNPYALSSSGGVRATAIMDVDVAVRHGASFCKASIT